MKKSFITSFAIASLGILIAITSAPALVGAQSYYSYSGYNARPYWKTIPNMTVVQGQTLSTSVQAIDENGDVLSYTLVQAPAGATYNNASRLFIFTPTYDQMGSFPVTISATDGYNQPVVATFYVSVTTSYGRSVYGGGDYNGYYNQPPYFTNTNSYYTASSGSNLNFQINATDPEGQIVRYSVSGLPAGASFDNNTRRFNWTPITGQRGTYTVLFYATDGSATSSALTISIVVDGGLVNYNSNNVYYPNNTATTYYPPTNTYGTTNVSYYGANSYGYDCSNLTRWPGSAVAGQMFTFAFRSCDPNGYPINYRLIVGPTGAVMNGNVLTWDIPANVQDQSYTFTFSGSNGYSSTNQTFNLAVSGGTPTITTVTTPTKNVVRYITVPAAQPAAPVAPTVTPVASYYPQQYQQPTYTNGQTVNVTAGRVVPPTNYQYYGATAYGALVPMTAAAIDISTFNIAVRVSSDKQMIVSWDTNKPTGGEVVFGYSSQSRGPDLDRTILNYDFTTGPISGTNTRHEANLGTLDLNRTYYLRVISRADNQTDISREIVFIPMTTQEGKIIVNQSEGAAYAAGSFTNFLTSGGFLFFLLLVVLALIIYLIMISRRPIVSRGTETNFNFAPANEFDTHGTNGLQNGNHH